VTWLQVIVLAIVQGLTEFLPISSSGHLVLVPSAAGWSDQGLAFDVAVHFGSLIAVCLFFRDDIFALLRGSGQILKFDMQTHESRMAFAIGIGTIPAAVAGLAFAGWIEANLRSPVVIVGTLAGYAVVMILADRFGSREKNCGHPAQARDRHRLRTGARADSGHVTFGCDDFGRQDPRFRPPRCSAILVPAVRAGDSARIDLRAGQPADG
jgi:undecaprenyl pyrophosphate phosphatase UppP